MIAVFSDTHSSRGHELEGEALAAARDADVVLHAGDFTTEAARDAFQDVCERLFAVHGNADDPAVRDRLPDARTVECDGVRFALTHRRDGGQTGLALFGRSRDADVVVSGHTHRPLVTRTDDVLLHNPGSHARPRGNRPGFGTIDPTTDGGGFRGRLLEPDGTLLEQFEYAASDESR